MWTCDWEYENQETLKQWYEGQLSGEKPDYIVRKIICKGCGKTFTPKRSDAVYCCNARRQRTYRQSVTDNGGGQKYHLIIRNEKGKGVTAVGADKMRHHH